MASTYPNQPVPGNRVFKVLSIDGGGIKGLYTAAMLVELEGELAKVPGHPRLSEYFDLIAGTSTGALIACALASGKTCHEILDVYRNMAQKIFPDINKFSRFGRSVRQYFFGARYSDQPFQEALHELLGDFRFSNAQNYLLIPVTDLQKYRPRFFKTQHSRHHFVDDFKLRDIVLASAAAPTYFPIASVPDSKDGLYGDGGLVANNPTMIAALEALSVFVGKESEHNTYNQLAVLSLGTYGSPTGLFLTPFTGHILRSKSSLGWIFPRKGALPLIASIMDSQISLTASSVVFLQRSAPQIFVKYARRDAKTSYPSGENLMQQSQYLSFGLADARPQVLEELERIGRLQGKLEVGDIDMKYFFQFPREPIQLLK